MPALFGLRAQRVAVTALVCAGLILAACTRSANQNNALPTATSPEGGLAINGDQDATMAAIGTEVSAQLTQTAVAAGAGGGAEVVVPTNTPAPGDTAPALPTPNVPLPTDTPVPGAIATPAPAGGAVACPNPYTVRAGDWIYKIARTCGLSPQAIIAANPGINPNFLSIGQVINLPTGQPSGGPAPSAGCTGTHTVVTGETLYRLSYNCGLTVEQLAATNGIVYPYIIYVGQALRFP